MKTLFLILYTLILSCSSPKSTTIENNIIIAFGNGGGFTGIETKYELKNDGTIYKIQMQDSSVVIVKKVEQKQIEKLFKDAEDLKDYKYFKPENMYQFIEINKNRIVWGFTTENVNPKAIALYQQLTTLLK